MATQGGKLYPSTASALRNSTYPYPLGCPVHSQTTEMEAGKHCEDKMQNEIFNSFFFLDWWKQHTLSQRMVTLKTTPQSLKNCCNQILLRMEHFTMWIKFWEGQFCFLMFSFVLRTWKRTVWFQLEEIPSYEWNISSYEWKVPSYERTRLLRLHLIIDIPNVDTSHHRGTIYFPGGWCAQFPLHKQADSQIGHVSMLHTFRTILRQQIQPE